MSLSTAIANPVPSLTTLDPSSVVSGLENALMQNIGQGLQSGQSTNSGSLQQEMQLLTDLLNQSDNGQSNSSPASSADPSTNSGDPSSTSDPSASSAPSSTSSDPSTGSSSSRNNNGIGKPERKLESALEQNITNRLQNGQSPNNGNSLEQEMNLLIQLLGQSA